MTVFVVVMSHPDGEGWGRFVKEHVDYLKGLISHGKILASGRVVGRALRSGLIVFNVADRREVDALIQGDPFTREGLIAELSVDEWDPLFGAFADYSTGNAKELDEHP